MGSCYICGLPLEWWSRSTSFYHARCIRCGTYSLSDFAKSVVEPQSFTEEQAANVSGYIRENSGLQVLEKDIAKLKSLRTPTVAEKALKGLMALAQLHPVPGAVFAYNPDLAAQRLLLLHAAVVDAKSVSEACDDEVRESLELQARCWARSFSELRYLLNDYFPREGLIHNDPLGPRHLTPKGWAAVDEAHRGTIPSDKAFVAMAFRECLRSLYDDGIAVGIHNAGYDPVRMGSSSTQQPYR